MCFVRAGVVGPSGLQAVLEGTSPVRVRGPTETATPRLQASPQGRDSLPLENLLPSGLEKGQSETPEAAYIVEIS